MVNEEPKHDDNRNPVNTAVDDTTGDVRNLKVKHGTDELKVDASITSGLPTDYAKETGGNLATIAGKDFATQTTLALIKTKTDNLTNNPSLETGGNLASIKAKTDNIPTDPAKESGKLTTIDSTLTSIKSTDGIKKITDPLPAGANVIGNVGINGVAIGANVIVAALPTGTNVIGGVKISNGVVNAIFETDDASIASGQKTLLVINLNYVYSTGAGAWIPETIA